MAVFCFLPILISAFNLLTHFSNIFKNKHHACILHLPIEACLSRTRGSTHQQVTIVSSTVQEVHNSVMIFLNNRHAFRLQSGKLQTMLSLNSAFLDSRLGPLLLEAIDLHVRLV